MGKFTLYYLLGRFYNVWFKWYICKYVQPNSILSSLENGLKRFIITNYSFAPIKTNQFVSEDIFVNVLVSTDKVLFEVAKLFQIC
jgi:hypothetical protein